MLSADATARRTAPCVTLLADLDGTEVAKVLSAYRVTLVPVAAGERIPGSYWGDPEAGLIGDRLYARADTPAHSVLHELCHYICMDETRRRGLSTDAGGDVDEECGVCYLQILLADEFAAFGRDRCLDDMDTWGYSFREGSAQRWLSGDGALARSWLLAHGLIDAASRPRASWGSERRRRLLSGRRPWWFR